VFILRIGTDPTDWEIPQDLDIDALAQQLAAGPVVLPVSYPLNGTLVVSARNAGAVSFALPGLDGSHPTDADLPSPVIHLPSATAPTHDAPGGDTLPRGTDMRQLQQDIVAAMTDGSFLTVQTSSVPGGALVLSGATLAYAVLCPPVGTG
jgi:uncharacterized protein YheU (UPF0270 family)